MEITIKELIDLGMPAVTFFLLLRVMNRLDALTDKIITYLETANIERRSIAQAVGAPVPPKPAKIASDNRTDADL